MVVPSRIRSPEGIAVDYISKNLYLTDSMYGVVSVVRLKSDNFADRRDLLTGLVRPRAIIVSPSLG